MLGYQWGTKLCETADAPVAVYPARALVDDPLARCSGAALARRSRVPDAMWASSAKKSARRRQPAGSQGVGANGSHARPAGLPFRQAGEVQAPALGARGLLRRARVLVVEVREVDLDRRCGLGCGQAEAVERFGQLLRHRHARAREFVVRSDACRRAGAPRRRLPACGRWWRVLQATIDGIHVDARDRIEATFRVPAVQNHAVRRSQPKSTRTAWLAFPAGGCRLTCSGGTAEADRGAAWDAVAVLPPWRAKLHGCRVGPPASAGTRSATSCEGPLSGGPSYPGPERGADPARHGR